MGIKPPPPASQPMAAPPAGPPTSNLSPPPAYHQQVPQNQVMVGYQPTAPPVYATGQVAFPQQQVVRSPRVVYANWREEQDAYIYDHCVTKRQPPPSMATAFLAQAWWIFIVVIPGIYFSMFPVGLIVAGALLVPVALAVEMDPVSQKYTTICIVGLVLTGLMAMVLDIVMQMYVGWFIGGIVGCILLISSISLAMAKYRRFVQVCHATARAAV